MLLSMSAALFNIPTNLARGFCLLRLLLSWFVIFLVLMAILGAR